MTSTRDLLHQYACLGLVKLHQIGSHACRLMSVLQYSGTFISVPCVHRLPPNMRTSRRDHAACHSDITWPIYGIQVHRASFQGAASLPASQRAPEASTGVFTWCKHGTLSTLLRCCGRALPSGRGAQQLLVSMPYPLCHCTRSGQQTEKTGVDPFVAWEQPSPRPHDSRGQQQSHTPDSRGSRLAQGHRNLTRVRSCL